jgi:hypothetical protein
MIRGDGIRRNIKSVDPDERAALRDAIKELNNRHFPGSRSDTPPGGVSWWFKQDEIHQATHVHGGPEFLPWHRELTNRFEALIRQINPQLSLHYWDFKEDPRALPNANLGGGNIGTLNLFDANFMGSPGAPDPNPPFGPTPAQLRTFGPAGDPWLGAGFYDPQAGTSGHPPDRDATRNPVDPPVNIPRPSNYPGPAPSPLINANTEAQILALQQYGPGAATNPGPFNPNQFFRTAWENIHNSAHPYFANISPHNAFRDPFVFLLHSNVDRVFAMWQRDPSHPERLDPNQVYGAESNLDVNVNAVGIQSVQNLTHLVEPFSTGHGQFADIRPWAAPENQGQPHTYHDLSVVSPPSYDTIRSVTFALDRDHYGQDEVDALRAHGSPVVKGAFFVIVDGFTPKDLGITGPTSLSAAPVVTFSPSTGLVNPAVCTSLESDDPLFGPEFQRFRFGYEVNFGSNDSAFTSFTGDSETVTLSTTYQGISANAQVQFIKQPDPYILQGPQTWWLSNDVRLIQVKEGGSAFGVPFAKGEDPFAFLSALTNALEAGQGMAGGQKFDDNTQEDTEVIAVAPTDGSGNKVYNYAIARVHYQGLSSKAQSVRVFFRLFAANSTATDFQPDTTYRRFAAYSPVYPVPPADDFQNVLPELGLSAGEYVTIPCFGEPRKDPGQSGSANTLPSQQTPDSSNVKDLAATGSGPVHDTFYGCLLDINQTDPGSKSKMPAMPPSGNADGPWPGLTLEPIQQAFIANDHTCIVAEIAFDPVPISTGTPPFNSDKLAQRNISWSYVANPGVEASRRAQEPFEVRPTPAKAAPGESPDELMIDWNNVPQGQAAEIYMPAVDADAVIAKASELYRVERLTRVDAHTIGCTTGGVTYIPLPKGLGDGANFTGLLSVNLPMGIRKGQNYTVLVRQLTNASGRVTPPPPPPPKINAQKAAVAVTLGDTIQWRRVLGTFQVNIPVSTKEILLPREERRLSIFRWIGEAMPPQRRWYSVFQRYLEGIAQKVEALGGDPNQILPSPTGDFWKTTNCLNAVEVVNFLNAQSGPVAAFATDLPGGATTVYYRAQPALVGVWKTTNCLNAVEVVNFLNAQSGPVAAFATDLPGGIITVYYRAQPALVGVWKTTNCLNAVEVVNFLNAHPLVGWFATEMRGGAINLYYLS